MVVLSHKNMKYGSSWGEWCSNEASGTDGIDLWKNTRKGWSEFSWHTRSEVHNGSMINMWQDKLHHEMVSPYVCLAWASRTFLIYLLYVVSCIWCILLLYLDSIIWPLLKFMLFIRKTKPTATPRSVKEVH